MTQKKSAGSAIPSEWQPIVSGNAELKLSSVLAGRLPALQMDFDFKGGGGFVVARRALKQRMPEEYAVSFRLRGRGGVNHLELKLVDATGQNVWRHVQRDLRLPQRWTRMRVDSPDIHFAGGPSSGGRLPELGVREFALGAGERLSCPQLEQRRSLENRLRRNGGGRQTQLCVSAWIQNPISSPGDR